MASRRRGANTGNSSPVPTRTYELRDRTKGKGDASPLARSAIKNSGKETKDQPVEKNVKNKSRRAPKPAEPDTDNDSEGDSKNGDNSRGGSSENDRQSHFTPTKASSGSSAKQQPSQPRHVSSYAYDLVRPRIGSSYDSAKKQPHLTTPVMEDTEEVEEKRYYYKGESLRGSTQTGPSRSSSEDDEKEIIQERQKPKDQFIEKTQYKEKPETWRSPDQKTDRRPLPPVIDPRRTMEPPRGVPGVWQYSREDLGTRLRHQLKDSREDLGTRLRHQSKVNTETQPASARKLMGFSDDEEEPATRRQQKEVSFPRQNKMNHNPEKNVEQKGNLSRKPRTSFFRCFAACMKYFVLTLLFVLAVGLAAVLYVSPESVHKFTDQFLDKPEVKKDLKGDFEKLTSVFTNQSPLMWKRSRVILERHLENWKENPEPAILLLTGARDAEQTLRCIGTRLAEIYSSSLGGNYTVISGSDWASESNEVVKAHIDDHLSARFQAKTSAAMLHRLELLPSGSLLILYKYCDHESAVFKNVMLLFTVLLDDATLAKDMALNDLEETVRQFLIQKLIDPNGAASHDGMDHDKFSGVWSRISHVVLPVFPEENIPEQCVKKPI